MFKIATTALCATMLFCSATGAMAASADAFQTLKGSTTPASSLGYADGGAGVRSGSALLVEGVISKQQGHSGVNYVLTDNTGVVAMHVPSFALGNADVEGQYVRAYGHLERVAGGLPLVSVSQIEMRN